MSYLLVDLLGRPGVLALLQYCTVYNTLPCWEVATRTRTSCSYRTYCYIR